MRRERRILHFPGGYWFSFTFSCPPGPGKDEEKGARIHLRAGNKNSPLIILAFLVFDGLSAPSIPLISPQTHLKLHLGWTHSPGSAQLETRKQQAKASTLFHLELSSSFTARHLSSLSTPPPSWHLQRCSFKCCRNEELLLWHHSVCNLSAARRQKPPPSNWCWYEGGALRPSADVLQQQNCKRKTREERLDSGGVHQSVTKRSHQR